MFDPTPVNFLILTLTQAQVSCISQRKRHPSA